MINKSIFSIRATKKVLHKVGKRWIIVSAVLLGLITGGTVATAYTSHADANGNPSQINHISHPLNKSQVRNKDSSNGDYWAPIMNSAKSNATSLSNRAYDTWNTAWAQYINSSVSNMSNKASMYASLGHTNDYVTSAKSSIGYDLSRMPDNQSNSNYADYLKAEASVNNIASEAAVAYSYASVADQSITDYYTQSVSSSVAEADQSKADAAAKDADQSIENSYASSGANSADVSIKNAIASSYAKSADDSLVASYQTSVSNSVARTNSAVASADQSVADYYISSVNSVKSYKNSSMASSAASSADQRITTNYKNSVSNSVSSTNASKVQSAQQLADSSIANSYNNWASSKANADGQKKAKDAASNANQSIANYYNDSVTASVSKVNSKAASVAANVADKQIAHSVSASVSKANSKIASEANRAQHRQSKAASKASKSSSKASQSTARSDSKSAKSSAKNRRAASKATSKSAKGASSANSTDNKSNPANSGSQPQSSSDSSRIPGFPFDGGDEAPIIPYGPYYNQALLINYIEARLSYYEQLDFDDLLSVYNVDGALYHVYLDTSSELGFDVFRIFNLYHSLFIY